MNFKKHIPSFCRLLDKANPAAISATDYAKEYLQHLLQHKRYYLSIYAAVLEKTFSELDYKTCSFIDFGTGNGLLALFAKYCGVKSVYANDINPGFINAAQQLSTQLNISIAGWVAGDENSLLQYFENIKPDALAGTDVIEHVYDLDVLFKAFKKLNPDITIVLTTAVFEENPFKAAMLKKIQRRDELKDSNAFHASGDNKYAGLGFLEIRKKIIRNLQPAMQQEKINELAIRTRGLRKDDIEKAVTNFLQTGIMPQVLQHPTNTCDPITGSWTERLLSIKEYKTIFNTHGFALEVYNGFYNSYSSGIKSFAAVFINGITRLFSTISLPVLTFIILKGTKK